MLPIVLRSYQAAAIAQIGTLLRDGHSRCLLVAPTGAGKTVMAARIVASAVSCGRRVLWLAHRVELVEQATATLQSYGLDVACLIAGMRAVPTAPVLVAMVQTAARRQLPPADIVIVDEAHHIRARSYERILSDLSPRYVIGLTATPQRTDGRGLGRIFSGMVVAARTSELISSGSLAPYRYYAPSSLDLSGIRTRAGEYAQDHVVDRMSHSTIVGDAIEHYQRLAGGMQFIAFTPSVDMARQIATRFGAAGILAAPLDGGMDAGERADIVARYRAGTLRGLVSCDLISEGFDVPEAGCAILLRPTKSLIIYLQQVGRVLRPAPGKTAIILDHVSNWERHGLPCTDRQWSLEDACSRPQPTRLGTRRCQGCGGIYYSRVSTCPYCGHVHVATPRMVRRVDGQLSELVDVTQRMPLSRPHTSGATLEDLIRIARARGYRVGWAYHVYRARMARRARSR